MQLVADYASVEALLEEMPNTTVLSVELLRVRPLKATHSH